MTVKMECALGTFLALNHFTWLVATILDGAAIDHSIPAEISLGHHRSTVIRRSLPYDFIKFSA